MPCRLISQVSKMARLIPADFFFVLGKSGFSERLMNSVWKKVWLEADASSDPTFTEPLFTQLPVGGDVQLVGCRGVLLRPSGCQFGPRPFQCRRTHCDGAAIFVCWLQHVTTVNR